MFRLESVSSERAVRPMLLAALVLSVIALATSFSDGFTGLRLPAPVVSTLALGVLVVGAGLLVAFGLSQLSAAGRRPVPVSAWRVGDAWMLMLVLVGGGLGSWNDLVTAAGVSQLVVRPQWPTYVIVAVMFVRLAQLTVHGRLRHGPTV